MDWCLTNRADPVASAIADRHYTRQSVGSRQFVPPGRCMVLIVPDAPVLWVSSWPKAQYVRHAWAGAWICTLFRNEAPGSYRSSALINEAVAATRAVWGKPPKQGFITFVDPSQVRTKRDPGRCYRRAGWRHVGYTQGGLIALQLLPADMPSPLAPFGFKAPSFRDTSFCLFCDKPLEQKRRGRIKHYCDDVCRQNACRVRKILYKEGCIR